LWLAAAKGEISLGKEGLAKEEMRCAKEGYSATQQVEQHKEENDSVDINRFNVTDLVGATPLLYTHRAALHRQHCAECLSTYQFRAWLDRRQTGIKPTESSVWEKKTNMR
jgi:hypothetical protein